MTLRSVYIGEGFATKFPGQFVRIMKMWVYQTRCRELMALINQLGGRSLSDQAELLVNWIDNNATIGQRDSCIQYLIDAIY